MKGRFFRISAQLTTNRKAMVGTVLFVIFVVVALIPGVIARDESVVVCITGNGYKTAAETIGTRVAPRVEISRSLEDFEAYLHSSREAAAIPAGQ